MENMFTPILALVMVITGIIWCFNHLKRLGCRRERIALGYLEDNKFSKVTQALPHWLETCASVFPVLLLVFVVRSFVYEPFRIPSGSMMPTLLTGDFILVQKYAYGVKNPLTQTTLIKTGFPKRGDIAVFKYPPNPKLNYIKRVIGLPGDRIIYNPINKHVTIKVSHNINPYYDKIPKVTYSDEKFSDFVQVFRLDSISDTSNVFYQSPLSSDVSKNGIRLHEVHEKIGRKTHSIIHIPGIQDQVSDYYKQPSQSLAEWVVPIGHYFMMGDNRDNSADSRYWGFVPEKNLVGKATAIWISFDKQEGKWPTGLRLSRIGIIG